MLIDISMEVTPALLADAKRLQKKELEGHLCTHFDAMDKEFPLEYTRREGILIDVRGVMGRDVDVCDVDLSLVKKDTFVAFLTGYSTREPYGSRTYFSESPQLSHALIRALVEKGVSIIALDCGGIRRGAEHIPADQWCADHGVFVVENLCDMEQILVHGDRFTAHTYPLRFTGISGHPCRVIAEV